MSTPRRAPALSSVLLLVLLNGAPSEGQNVLSTDSGSNSIAVMYPATTMYPAPTSIPKSTEASVTPPVLSIDAIIGIAVGGGSVLGSALILCLCICVCCLCIKTRRNKHFNPSVTEKQPINEGSPAYHTLTPPDLSLDLVKNEEFEMQANVALSFEDVNAESAGHNIKPTELFAVSKSASTSNIPETRIDNKDSTPATKSTFEANSVPSVRLPELKGYVEMSSAGSIQPSKSAGDVNVADLSEEQDVGIYVEPDRTAAAVLLQSELYRDPPPAAPPKLHPKTPSITAIIAAENSASKARHEPVLTVTEEVGVMEEYVEPDVFRVDRQTQEEIDSYYNKDTIESIRQGRGLSDVTDPSDALYTNVNSSTPTHSQQHKTTDLIDDDHLGNREEFLSGSTAVANMDVSGTREGYYNVKHHTDDSDGEDDYYNSVPGAGTSSSQPLLDPEDNQYIYIQNSDVPRTGGATAAKPAVAAKPRHLSSPVAQPKKKYINLGPNQRQILQDKVQVTAVKTIEETRHVTVANGGSMEAASFTDDSSNQSLYENLCEDEEDDEGKEIYENIVR